MFPVDPEFHQIDRDRKHHLHQLPPDDNQFDLIKTLVDYLIKELPPIGRHIRAGALLAALTLIIGVVTDILADPQLYAAVIMVASIIAGVIGQGAAEVEKQVIKSHMAKQSPKAPRHQHPPSDDV